MSPGNKLEQLFLNSKVRSWGCWQLPHCGLTSTPPVCTEALVWQTLFHEATRHHSSHHLHARLYEALRCRRCKPWGPGLYGRLCASTRAGEQHLIPGQEAEARVQEWCWDLNPPVSSAWCCAAFRSQ